jgi:hypothetical protein
VIRRDFAGGQSEGETHHRRGISSVVGTLSKGEIFSKESCLGKGVTAL